MLELHSFQCTPSPHADIARATGCLVDFDLVCFTSDRMCGCSIARRWDGKNFVLMAVLLYFARMAQQGSVLGSSTGASRDCSFCPMR